MQSALPGLMHRVPHPSRRLPWSSVMDRCTFELSCIECAEEGGAAMSARSGGTRRG